jgi:hypothetical protein
VIGFGGGVRGEFDVDMMAKRDHAGVFGLGEGSGRDAGTTGEEHRLVRRPIPSVPDTRLGGGAAAAQTMSRMTSPTPDQGFPNLRNNTSSHVTRPGNSYLPSPRILLVSLAISPVLSLLNFQH